MTLSDIDELAALHPVQRVRLVTTIGVQGLVHIGGDPDRLVGNLIRLARIGAVAREVARETPRRRIGAVVREIEGSRA